VHIPTGITSLDLDVIKLTAQFVARNGKSFLTGLTSRGRGLIQNNHSTDGTPPPPRPASV
jgi:hypothetical protein